MSDKIEKWLFLQELEYILSNCVNQDLITKLMIIKIVINKLYEDLTEDEVFELYSQMASIEQKSQFTNSIKILSGNVLN